MHIVDEARVEELAEIGVATLRRLELDGHAEATIADLLDPAKDGTDRDAALAFAWFYRQKECEAALLKARRYGLGEHLKALTKHLKALAKRVDAEEPARRAENSDPGVWGRLSLTKKGDPVPHMGNLKLILAEDPRWAGKIILDTFKAEVFIDGEALKDAAETEINCWLCENYSLALKTTMIHEAIVAVATQNSVNCVTDYLDSLVWDGKKRIDDLLGSYMGAGDAPILRAYSRKWLISAIARARQPGCKVDTALILHGEQGKQKSTAFKVLGGEWFSDSGFEIGSKDAMQGLQGVWIYEVAELESFRKRENTAVKSFLSSQSDRFRPSYGRNSVIRPRSVVFCGSTNRDDFISDDSGSRRYWIASVGTIDLARLAADRDQLWAEADAAYRAGEQWWLTNDEESLRVDASDRYLEQDPWTPLLMESSVHEKGPVHTRYILEFVLGIKPADQTKALEARLGAALRALGWTREKTRKVENGRRLAYRWVPPGSDTRG